MKTCSKCREEKGLSDFHKGQARCKVCRKESSRAYYRKNREEIRAKQEVYQAENREELNEYARQYRKENPDYYKNKPSWYSNSVQAKRRSAKLQRTPNWLSEGQLDQMAYTYWLAKDLERTCGEKYHVDHIVPLQGKEISGLHVPWNLQVLPEKVNLSKGNRV